MADTQLILRNEQLPLYVALLRDENARTTFIVNTGIAKRLVFGESRVYMGAGLRGVIAANQASHTAPTVSTNEAARSDRIAGPEILALLEEVRLKTGGTFNLDDMPLRAMMDTVQRYPALVKPEHAEAIANVSRQLDRASQQIESSRQWLVGYLATQNAMPQAQQWREDLSRPLTTGTLDHITLGDLRKQTNSAMQGLQSISQAMTLNPPNEQQLTQLMKFEKMVTAQTAQQPSNVPMQQRVSQVMAMLNQTQTQLAQFNATIPQLVAPSELAHTYELARKVMAYDPVVRATAYAAALHESQPFATPTRVVLGAMIEQGMQLDTNSIAGIREGNVAELRLTPAHVTNRSVFAGVGNRSAATAVPPGLEEMLSLPPAMRNDLGAYIQYQQSLRSDTPAQKSIAAGVRYMIDPVTEAVLSAQCPLKPTQTPCITAVTLGRKF